MKELERHQTGGKTMTQYILQTDKLGRSETGAFLIFWGYQMPDSKVIQFTAINRLQHFRAEILTHYSSHTIVKAYSIKGSPDLRAIELQDPNLDFYKLFH